MKTQTIKAIFTNLLFVIGVILLVIGFIRGTSTAVKMVVFEKYPLQNHEETRCELGQTRAMPLEEKPIEVDEATKEENKEKCLNDLEHARKVKQVEDVTASISLLISGFVLTFIFKRFIFSKKS